MNPRTRVRLRLTGAFGTVVDHETGNSVNVRFDGYPDVEYHIPDVDLEPMSPAAEILRCVGDSIKGEEIIGLVAQLSDHLHDCAGGIPEQVDRLTWLLRAVRDREEVQRERDTSWHPAEYDAPVEVAERDVIAAASTLIHGDVTWCALCYTSATKVGGMRLATGRVGAIPLCTGCLPGYTARAASMQLHPTGGAA